MDLRSIAFLLLIPVVCVCTQPVQKNTFSFIKRCMEGVMLRYSKHERKGLCPHASSTSA
jgi:hypothetical protein